MSATELTVTIHDEGLYSKDFQLRRTTRLRKLFERYFDGICTACTDQTLLEFWFQATQIQGDHTPESLGIEDGDIIDVRVSERHTSGACPLPPQQTLPNVHYLAPAKLEPEPARVNLVLEDLHGFRLEFSLKVTGKFGRVMREYAVRNGVEVGGCRFVFEGVRVTAGQTPEECEMVDGDKIEVYHVHVGG